LRWFALVFVGCTTTNIHDTDQVKGHACFQCHSEAYAQVQTPVHVGVYPNTCESCHMTTAWIPTSNGHPEALFPITTGSHHNAAIGCSDCHLPSLGPSAQGQNTDCIHCHIGAHTIPSIDAVHPLSLVPTYTPANPATPHSCLTVGCHPTG
jgi:hypothetical protein